MLPLPSTKALPTMPIDLIDCTCFRLPAPANMSLCCVHPAHLYLHVDRADIPRPVTTCMFIQKKTPEDKQHPDFSALFRARWASRRYEEDYPVEQKTIGEHSAWFSPAFDNTSHDFVLSAAIDLDEDHYLYASAGYYMDKSHTIFNHVSLEDKELSIFTKDEDLEAFGNVFANLQKIKQAVASDAYNYLLSLLANLQLLGGYAQAIQAQQDGLAQNAPQRQKNAPLVEETHFDFIRPDSLGLLGDFYGGTDKAVAKFKLRHGTGRMEAELLRRETETRHMDFSEFFYDWVFFRHYQKHAMTPVVTLNIDNHTAKLACSLRPDGRFSFISAIEPDDADNICFLEFEADYEIDAMALSATDEKASRSALAFQPPFSAKTNALAEVYDHFLQILASMRIKDQVIHESKRQAEREAQKEHDARNARMQLYMSRYTTAEDQAADPFHARHYPDFFKQLQDVLAKHPDLLPYEKGIYSNARLTIGFKANAFDDYSEKGNTRFFGLPDLPPNVEYPKVDPTEKDNKGNYWKFIAQINFSELNGMCEYLPERGIAYFFIESQYDELSHVEGDRFQKSLYRHKVFYYDGDVNNLISANDLDIPPEYIFDVDAGYEDEDGAQPARAEIFPCVCIMNYEDLEHDENGNELYPNYPPLIIEEDQLVPIRQFNYALLGDKRYFHSAINGSVENVYHGSPYTQAANTLGGNPEDYVLLLQVEGNSEYSGYDFGDADTLYFLIHKEKLKNLDFSQVYCSMTWWWAEFGNDDD